MKYLVCIVGVLSVFVIEDVYSHIDIQNQNQSTLNNMEIQQSLSCHRYNPMNVFKKGNRKLKRYIKQVFGKLIVRHKHQDKDHSTVSLLEQQSEDFLNKFEKDLTSEKYFSCGFHSLVVNDYDFYICYDLDVKDHFRINFINKLISVLNHKHTATCQFVRYLIGCQLELDHDSHLEGITADTVRWMKYSDRERYNAYIKYIKAKRHYLSFDPFDLNIQKNFLKGVLSLPFIPLEVSDNCCGGIQQAIALIQGVNLKIILESYECVSVVSTDTVSTTTLPRRGDIIVDFHPFQNKKTQYVLLSMTPNNMHYSRAQYLDDYVDDIADSREIEKVSRDMLRRIGW